MQAISVNLFLPTVRSRKKGITARSGALRLDVGPNRTFVVEGFSYKPNLPASSFKLKDSSVGNEQMGK